MNPFMVTLQYLFEKGHENIKFLLEITGMPRRTLYDNLKKFKLQGNITRKEGNSIQMTAEDYHFW